MNLDENTGDIFEKLLNGATVTPQDPQIHRLQEASYSTKQLLVKMNSSSDPSEIRSILGEITGSRIPESTSVFTPSYINYGKNRNKPIFNSGETTINNYGLNIISQPKS